MLALLLAGILITFNILPQQLGLGFELIRSVQSGFWIILVRIVGIFLMTFPIWVIINVIKEGF